MPASREVDTFAALERREWSKRDVARSYASDFSRAADMVAPTLVAAIEARTNMTALDLCCGQGNVTASLCKTGARVVGVDFSAAMLDMARSAVPAASFIRGDVMSLALKDQSVDRVTIGFGMPHVPDPPRVLAEVRRVLRPGGRIAFSVWCGPDTDSALGYVFNAIEQHGSSDIALPPGPGAHDYADPAIAFPVLEQTGFRDYRQIAVASKWQLDDPGTPYDYFRDGTARGGALLRTQPAQCAAAIKAAVVAKVLARHGSGPVWNVPIPAVVTVASVA